MYLPSKPTVWAERRDDFPGFDMLWKCPECAVPCRGNISDLDGNALHECPECGQVYNVQISIRERNRTP